MYAVPFDRKQFRPELTTWKPARPINLMHACAAVGAGTYLLQVLAETRSSRFAVPSVVADSFIAGRQERASVHVIDQELRKPLLPHILHRLNFEFNQFEENNLHR